MQCENTTITYVFRPGDTLYNIAQHYGTTVENILSYNPHLNVYNLRIGEVITFCLDQPPIPAEGEDYVITLPELDLSNDMREIWAEHMMWTRMLILSIIDNLKDVDVVTNRLLRNPRDLAALFRNYYGNAVASRIEELITEHLTIGGALIQAVKNGNSAEADRLNSLWYQNADEIAETFASINPYYSLDEMREMFHMHLDLVKQEVSARLAGNYAADVAVYDQIEQQGLTMADVFSNGIVNQFPDAFF